MCFAAQPYRLLFSLSWQEGPQWFYVSMLAPCGAAGAAWHCVAGWCCVNISVQDVHYSPRCPAACCHQFSGQNLATSRPLKKCVEPQKLLFFFFLT